MAMAKVQLYIEESQDKCKMDKDRLIATANVKRDTENKSFNRECKKQE